MKALVATLPKLDQEYEDVQHKIANANTVLEEAERRHSEISNPLNFRPEKRCQEPFIDILI